MRTIAREVLLEKLGGDGEGAPLAKAEITSQLLKTLNAMRARLSAREVELAEKAVRSLDVAAFMQILRGDAA